MTAVPAGTVGGARARPDIGRWLPLVLVTAGLSLLAALAGGLVRLGSLPASVSGVFGPQPVALHGALMVPGFFGAIIALERAVALHRGYWVPALAGIGGLLAWGLPPGAAWPGGLAPAGLAWAASAAGLLGLYAWAARHRHADLPLAVEASGALLLLVGTAAWIGGLGDAARLGWAAFLVLTIAGERRELSQLRRLGPAAQRLFLLPWAGLALAPLLAWRDPGLATTLWWLGTAGLALWLLACDLAPRQRRASGWAGHTAWCVIVACGWLLLAALAGLAGLTVAWHLLWLGHVMAMVMGHAPIMLPVLAGVRARPTRWALLPLAVMAASLALRAAGSLAGRPDWLAVAGAGHVLALLLFAATMAWAVRAERHARAAPRGQRGRP